MRSVWVQIEVDRALVSCRMPVESVSIRVPFRVASTTIPMTVGVRDRYLWRPRRKSKFSAKVWPMLANVGKQVPTKSVSRMMVGLGPNRPRLGTDGPRWLNLSGVNQLWQNLARPPVPELGPNLGSRSSFGASARHMLGYCWRTLELGGIVGGYHLRALGEQLFCTLRVSMCALCHHRPL